MKTKITIEIEGSKEEIDSLTHELSNFVKTHHNKIKMKPFKNMYPKGFFPKRRW